MVVLKRSPTGSSGFEFKGFSPKRKGEAAKAAERKLHPLRQRVLEARRSGDMLAEESARRKWNDTRPMGKMKGAAVYLEKMEKHREWPVNMKALHTALKTFSKFGVVDQIQRGLNLLTVRDMKPDNHLTMELVKALKKSDRMDDAIAIYHLLSRRGVEPDEYLQTYMLTQCAAMGRTEDVAFFEQELAKRKLSPVILSAMINSFGKLRDEEKVLGYFDEFLRIGYAHTTWTYASTMDALNKIQRYDLLEKLFEEAKENKRVQLSAYIYSTMIDSYADRRDRQSMEAALDDMAKRGIRCDDHCMSSVLNVYAKRLDVEEAESVFNTMRESGGAIGWIPSRIMLGMYAELGDADAARMFHMEMGKRGFPPRRRSFDLVLKACAKAGEVSQARRTMGEMTANRIGLNERSYSYLIQTISRSETEGLDSAVKVMIIAENANLEASSNMWKAKVFAYLRFAEEESAIDEFERMIQARIEVDAELYELVAEAFARRNVLHEAARFMAAASGFFEVDEDQFETALANVVKSFDLNIEPSALMERYRLIRESLDSTVKDDVDWVVERVP
mmetsp:Transcript_38773/g.153168  ORF Transcript_38773/g.153168 Transcript_38773/m.153168 type:complete len:561 (-) Transcript_38773:418-2100(-)